MGSEFPRRYVPFARKYRPIDLSEVYGQIAAVKILNSCILENRLAYAYLFVGSRGTGKTSLARIIAKTVNCSSAAVKDGIAVPCHKCINCNALADFAHPDVIEIDAASRTSVDDVRDIIENSQCIPILGKYKVFIVDEVHMLSKNAFNALLKIIEEPPSHVIFIFATTELRKIPLTVISRCQRFDLRRFSDSEICAILKKIAEKENIDVTNGALKIISVQCEGSARDAISILDQSVSFVLHGFTVLQTSQINEGVIQNVLGLVSNSAIVLLLQLIVANDTKAAISLLKETYLAGVDLEHYLMGVAEFIAELTKKKLITGYTSPVFDSFSQETDVLLLGLSAARLSVLWQIFVKGIDDFKYATNKLVSSEMTIIKSICASNMPSVDRMLLEINNNCSNNENKTATLNTTEITPVMTHEDIFAFLKYCHSKAELGVYYYLLNEVEIVSFYKTELVLRGRLERALLDKLKLLLETWGNRQYQLKFSNQDKIVNLKQKLLEEVKHSGDFNVIKNRFPQARISDIIIKQ